MSILRKILYALTILSLILYISWRILYTLPLEDAWYAILFGIFLIGSEIISSLTAAILIWSKHKEIPLVKPEISDEQYPHVDVLIVTHNEDIDILYKTLNAAKNMIYPDSNKIHIYITDDTNRDEVKELAQKFNIGYIGMKDNKHAKSGNINNALSKIQSPLVATFDADMIPYSSFLLETVPYFVQQEDKKKLGFVQTPQSFYNPDLFQFNFFSEKSIPNEQDFFSREVNVLNNAHEAAVYTGSNTVLLREAIDKVGGFPTDTITEDFELGALINAAGYSSISTLEPMASGLTPMDIPSMFKQRIRWARGVIRSVHNLKILTNKNLSFSQKMVFLNSYLYWWSFLRRIIYIMAPIMFTVFNTRVVVADIWQLFIFWLPGYILLHLTMRFTASDIRTQSWGEVQETVFAPYLIIPVILETIGIRETKFKVTSKSNINSSRNTILMLPHLILLLLSIWGFIKFNYNKFGSEILYGSIVSFWLLVHTFNLAFAVLFFLGRPIYRKGERFDRSFPSQFNYNDSDWIESHTVNISEGGLYLHSPIKLPFPSSNPIKVRIQNQDRQVTVSGLIVRETKSETGWVYGIKNNYFDDEEEYKVFLYIVYNGYNNSLARNRDPWVTPLDRLINILKMHFYSFSMRPSQKKTDTNLLYLDEKTIGDGTKKEGENK